VGRAELGEHVAQLIIGDVVREIANIELHQNPSLFRTKSERSGAGRALHVLVTFSIGGSSERVWQRRAKRELGNYITVEQGARSKEQGATETMNYIRSDIMSPVRFRAPIFVLASCSSLLLLLPASSSRESARSGNEGKDQRVDAVPADLDSDA